MKTFVALSITAVGLSACGRFATKKEQASKPPQTESSPVPDIQITDPENKSQKAYYGVIVGCVTAITPENAEKIETSNWRVTMGCSAVIDSENESLLGETLKKKATDKCPDVILNIIAVGQDSYNCSMKPNPPFLFTSNDKSVAETYAFGGRNCHSQVAQLFNVNPSIICIKQ